MTLNFLDEDDDLFKRPGQGNLFLRRDPRDAPVPTKFFKIISSTNDDKDWFLDDPNGNNNYREIVGIGIGFNLIAEQEVAFFANVNVFLPSEFNAGEIHGCDIKIVVDSTTDANSERKKDFQIAGLALQGDENQIVLQAITKQTLSAGYHRASIRAQGKEPTADFWGFVVEGSASLIAITGG